MVSFLPRLRPCAVLLALLTAVACTPGASGPRLANPHLPDGGYDERLRMARTALAAGQVDTAADLFQQALVAKPNDPGAIIGFGDTLLRRGRVADASEVYEKALPDGGADAHRAYARAMFGLKRPEVALEHLKQARNLDPDDIRIINMLGVAYDLTGQHAVAAIAYREGLTRAPDDTGLRNNLGLSLALAGDFKQSIEILREMAEAPGADARARQNLAIAYALSGNMAAAERLSRLDLGERDVRSNMRIFAALQGQDGAAIASAITPAVAAPAAAAAIVRPKAPVGPKRSPVRLASLALDAGDLHVGGAPTGRWVLNLGRDPDAQAGARRWQNIQRQAKGDIAGLTKLAGAGSGPEPLLVGPIGDEKSAAAMCARLARLAPSCTPLRL